MLLVRIEAIGGFIQDQHLRIVNERLGQTDAPPETLRQRFDHLVDDGSERKPVDHHVATSAPQGARQAADIGDEVEEFRARHLAVARGAFRKVAHARLGRHRCPFDVVAAYRHPARGGRDEAGDHAHGRGFAGAIGAEEAQDLARLHGEGKGVDGQFIAVTLGQIFRRNHGHL